MEDIGRLVEHCVADVVQDMIRGHCIPMNVGDLPVSQICDVVFVISDAFVRFAWCCVPGGLSRGHGIFSAAPLVAFRVPGVALRFTPGW